MPRTAEIIAVGNELLTGGVTNTNARFLSELLTAAGVDVLYHTAVGDDEGRLEAAVTAARQRAELLVCTGGLGPTYDDMTKTAVCAALDTPLVFHPDIVPDIRRYFDTVFHREMPACNLRQAYLPQDCTVFRNPVGTAPGCAFTAGGVTAVLLPGVPSECRYLAEHCLLPYLERLHGQVIRSHDLRIFGLTEPQVQELLNDLLHQEEDLTLAPYADTGEVSLHLSARAADDAACEARMAPLLAEVRRRLGSYLYGTDVSGLEETALRLCQARGLTLSAAESCTGGLIAQRLTSVSGSSEVFGYGFVTYWEQAKAKLVGVDPAVIEKYNVVSAPVAAQMALGAAKASGADIAVSVTGLAGPTGGDEVRPVGTVYLGAARDGVACVKKLFVSRPDRALVRARAAQAALELALRLAQGKVPAGTQALTAAQQSDDEALAALDEAFVR